MLSDHPTVSDADTLPHLDTPTHPVYSYYYTNISNSIICNPQAKQVVTASDGSKHAASVAFTNSNETSCYIENGLLYIYIHIHIYSL